MAKKVEKVSVYKAPVVVKAVPPKKLVFVPSLGTTVRI